MKIENLKPGDKVKLFKLETLIKKGLIKPSFFKEYADTQYTTVINKYMIDIWNRTILIKTVNQRVVQGGIIKDAITWVYKPEWIRCRVK